MVEKAKKYIEKLEELKDNLSYDNEHNYNKLIEIANNFDYDFDTCIIELTHDLIDEEIAEDILKSELERGGIDRARCFIGDTTTDSVYKMNGYGNLENVYISDFEDIINNIINEIEKEIKGVEKND